MYGGLVLGLQLPGTVALGAHEALHVHLEADGPCTTTWAARTAATACDWDREIPHALLYVISHAAGWLLLLPWLNMVQSAFRRKAP